MVRIAIHFHDVERRRGHHIGQVFRADLDHQVRVGHRAPELSFDQVTFIAGRHLFQRVHHQIMRADVCAVPIPVVDVYKRQAL